MARGLLKQGIDDFGWDQFEWKRWANSPELQLCSFEAQGVWMLMCVVMFTEGTPRGVMGEDLAAFARRVRHVDRLGIIRRCVRELEKARVFSRGREVLAASEGRDLSHWIRPDDIVCRHMFRRWLEKHLRSEAGRKGGLRSGVVRGAEKDVLSKSQRPANETRSKKSAVSGNNDRGLGDVGGKQKRTIDEATLSKESRTKRREDLDPPKQDLGEEIEGEAERGGEAASMAEVLAGMDLSKYAGADVATLRAEFAGRFVRVCGCSDGQSTWIHELAAVLEPDEVFALSDGLDRVERAARGGDTTPFEDPLGWMLKRRVYPLLRERGIDFESCPRRGAR